MSLLIRRFLASRVATSIYCSRCPQLLGLTRCPALQYSRLHSTTFDQKDGEPLNSKGSDGNTSGNDSQPPNEPNLKPETTASPSSSVAPTAPLAEVKPTPEEPFSAFSAVPEGASEVVTLPVPKTPTVEKTTSQQPPKPKVPVSQSRIPEAERNQKEEDIMITLKKFENKAASESEKYGVNGTDYKPVKDILEALKLGSYASALYDKCHIRTVADLIIALNAPKRKAEIRKLLKMPAKNMSQLHNAVIDRELEDFLKECRLTKYKDKLRAAKINSIKQLRRRFADLYKIGFTSIEMNQFLLCADWYHNIEVSFAFKNESAYSRVLALPKDFCDVIRIWWQAIGVKVGGVTGSQADFVAASSKVKRFLNPNLKPEELKLWENSLSQKWSVIEAQQTVATLIRGLYPKTQPQLLEMGIIHSIKDINILRQVLLGCYESATSMKSAQPIIITDYLRFRKNPNKLLEAIQTEDSSEKLYSESIAASSSLYWKSLPEDLRSVLPHMFPDLVPMISHEHQKAIKAVDQKLSAEADAHLRRMHAIVSNIPLELSYQSQSVKLPTDFWSEDFFDRQRAFWTISHHFRLPFPNFHDKKFTAKYGGDTRIPTPFEIKETTKADHTM